MKFMDFKKIKYTKNGGLELKYYTYTDMGEGVVSKTEVSTKCKDEPHPDLINALQALKPIVEYDEGYKKGTVITVTGISLFGDADTVIITHTKEKKSGTTVTNSGRISRESEDFGKTEQLFSLVTNVIVEAEEYVSNQKRAQLDMFNEAAA